MVGWKGIWKASGWYVETRVVQGVVRSKYREGYVLLQSYLRQCFIVNQHLQPRVYSRCSLRQLGSLYGMLPFKMPFQVVLWNLTLSLTGFTNPLGFSFKKTTELWIATIMWSLKSISPQMCIELQWQIIFNPYLKALVWMIAARLLAVDIHVGAVKSIVAAVKCRCYQK